MNYLEKARLFMKEVSTDCVKSVERAKRLPETKYSTERLHLKSPENLASALELAEIDAIVEDEDVCLLYSHVLKDYIAFVKNDSYLKDVPLGFLPYSIDELRSLFGGPDSLSSAKLRLVHEAKKLGRRVVDNEAIQ